MNGLHKFALGVVGFTAMVAGVGVMTFGVVGVFTGVFIIACVLIADRGLSRLRQ